MNKKIFFLVLVNLLLTFPVSAGPGGTGGIGTVPTLRMNGEIMLKRDEVSALITRNGDYARLNDLAEGFVRFKGVRVLGDHIELAKSHELEAVVLSTGLESRLSKLIGGDMGGGGSTAR